MVTHCFEGRPISVTVVYLNLVAWLLRGDDDESGQGLVEYGLVVVLIAIFVIITVKALGGQTSALYSNIGNGLAN